MVLEILDVRNVDVWDTPRRSTTTTVTCWDGGVEDVHGRTIENPPFGPSLFEDVDAVDRHAVQEVGVHDVSADHRAVRVDDLESVHRDVDRGAGVEQVVENSFAAVLDQGRDRNPDRGRLAEILGQLEHDRVAIEAHNREEVSGVVDVDGHAVDLEERVDVVHRAAEHGRAVLDRDRSQGEGSADHVTACAVHQGERERQDTRCETDPGRGEQAASRPLGRSARELGCHLMPPSWEKLVIPYEAGTRRNER